MTETRPPDTESGIHVRMRAYEEALREASCEIEEKVRELSLLRRIADIAGHVYDIELFYRFFLDMLLEETHAMNCSLLLLQENASRFVVKAARGRNDDGSLYDCDVLSETSFDVGQGIAGRAAMLRETLLIPDASADARFELRYTRTPILSLVCAPMPFSNRVIGVVNLSHPEKSFFSENTRRLMHIVCGLAGQIVGNALLHREQERRFQSMFEGVPFSIIIVDPRNDRIIDCNNFTESMLGYARQELIGMHSFTEILDPGQPEFFERLKRTSRADERMVHEAVLIRKGGGPCVCEITAGYVSYADRPVLRISAIDVTAKKELEKRLFQAEKLRSLGELASGVAHDVNNMLAAIIGRVDLMRFLLAKQWPAPDGSVPEALSAHLAVIEQAARDGAATVRRIQNFASSRNDTVPLGPVSLDAVIGDAVELTRTRWQGPALTRARPITVARQGAAKRMVMGNAAELREAFVNLINNAIDAMPGGGAITITTDDCGDMVEAVVTDTGPGIPPADKSRLFDPFFTTKGIGSSGLGLSIVYGIIQRHNGSIEETGTEGSGARFRIMLPCAVDNIPAAREAEPASGGGAGTAKRILLIEDDVHVGETLAELLTSSGHCVTRASNGDEGVQRCADGFFDLAITDLGMPGMNGFECARRLKQLRPQLPVILITGWNLTQTQQELREKGIDHSITKPFRIREMLSLIERATSPDAGSA